MNITILVWASQELNRQMDELKREDKASLFDPVEECPCGCGLKDDVCDAQLARVKAKNDALPF